MGKRVEWGASGWVARVEGGARLLADGWRGVLVDGWYKVGDGRVERLEWVWWKGGEGGSGGVESVVLDCWRGRRWKGRAGAGDGVGVGGRVETEEDGGVAWVLVDGWRLKRVEVEGWSGPS